MLGGYEMIEFKDVNVSFEVDNYTVHACKNINLKIKRGEVFGIVGLSGAGKSTLVRVINLLQKPSSGQILINGNDITHLKGENIRKVRLDIGMIFQHFNLISGKTVFENIEFVLKANDVSKEKRKERVEELLRLVDLSDKANAYPANLSGGQKQRVGIARALANNPEILLCDEATSALDLENTEEILNLLERISKQFNITIVFITHEMEVAKRLFDRVAVMSDGEIIEVNDVYSLFAHPEHEVTKSLINKNLNIDLPKEMLHTFKEGECIKISYKGEKSADPIISTVAKQFGVHVSIIHGKIDYIHGKPLGILLIHLSGDDAEIAKAKQYIKGNVAEMEEVVHFSKGGQV